MNNMTPRERIMATINRQPVDRPLVDLWCTPEVLDTLREYTSTQDELEVYNKLGVDKIVWIFPVMPGGTSTPMTAARSLLGASRHGLLRPDLPFTRNISTLLSETISNLQN